MWRVSHARTHECTHVRSLVEGWFVGVMHVCAFFLELLFADAHRNVRCEMRCETHASFSSPSRPSRMLESMD